MVIGYLNGSIFTKLNKTGNVRTT